MWKIRRQYQSKNGKRLGPGLDVRNIFPLTGGTENQTIPPKGKTKHMMPKIGQRFLKKMYSTRTTLLSLATTVLSLAKSEIFYLKLSLRDFQQDTAVPPYYRTVIIIIKTLFPEGITLPYRRTIVPRQNANSPRHSRTAVLSYRNNSYNN